ncbi:MAG TPA: hypothetical protein VF062_09315 [Candidatus Limnocylindrales bacterium]
MDEAERWLLRLGGASAVIGSLAAMVGNLVHPVTPAGDPAGVASTIAGSSAWTGIHLLIVFGIALMLPGLLALHRTIRGGLAGALSRMGWAMAIVGVAIGLVLVMLDGVAAKQLADAWAVAPDSEKAAALRDVITNETINFALAALFNLIFAAATFLLYGLAVAFSDIYPRWLGWIAVAAGLSSVAAGLIQAVTGEPTTASLVLTIIGPTVITLWLAVMGVLLYRRSLFRVDADTPSAG